MTRSLTYMRSSQLNVLPNAICEFSYLKPDSIRVCIADGKENIYKERQLCLRKQ